MNLKAFAAISCLGLASLALAPTAMADTWNKKTILTVNEPIQIPGKVLEPGKYVMKLMDSPSNRHIVQVFNEREDELQTTILAIPNYRMQPTGKTEFQWWETPAGQPKALRAWFYPGDNFGQEFAYPKREAVAIAAAVEAPVPTTAAQTEAELATAPVTTVDKEGKEVEPEQPRQVAQAQPPPAPMPEQPATPAPTAQPAPEEQQPLPRTASSLPMIGLAGFLALSASVTIRALAKRA